MKEKEIINTIFIDEGRFQTTLLWYAKRAPGLDATDDPENERHSLNSN